MVFTKNKSLITGLIAFTGVIAMSYAAQASDFSLDDAAVNKPLSALDPVNGVMARLKRAADAVESKREIRSMLNDGANTLTLSQQVAVQEQETTKFQHYFHGLEVIGSMALHHRSTLNDEETVVDRTAKFDLDAQPSISAEQAAEIARSAAGDRALMSEPELKVLPAAEDGSAQLIYWIEFAAEGSDGARQVMVDAHSGEVLGNVSRELHIAPIEVYSAAKQGALLSLVKGKDPKTGQPAIVGCTVTNMANGQVVQKLSAAQCQKLNPKALNACQIVLDGDGEPIAVNPKACKLVVQNMHAAPGADRSAGNASRNSIAVLNYYLTHHKRNSYDNQGSTVVSVVHGGVQLGNAFWDDVNNHMVYGDGDGKVMGDMTAALDVAGHEMTHGVVSRTAKFLGMGENGALNEAIADFFGIMIDKNSSGDWSIGKKVFLNPSQAPGVRNLSNPHSMTFCAQETEKGCAQRRPYPANIREMAPAPRKCDGSNDNCWVHANSTIEGHASYLVTQAIGPDKAERLYYYVLTSRWTARDNLRTAAAGVKEECPKVLDSDSCAKVVQAYAQVGM